MDQPFDTDLDTHLKEYQLIQSTKTSTSLVEATQKVLEYYYLGEPSDCPLAEIRMVAEDPILRPVLSDAILGKRLEKAEDSIKFEDSLKKREAKKKRKDVIQTIVYRKFRKHWIKAIRKDKAIRCPCNRKNFFTDGDQDNPVGFVEQMAEMSVENLHSLMKKVPFRESFYCIECFELILESMDQDTRTDIKTNIIEKIQWSLGISNAKLSKKYNKAPPKSEQQAIQELSSLLSTSKKSKLPMSKLGNREALLSFIQKLSLKATLYNLDQTELAKVRAWAKNLHLTEMKRFGSEVIIDGARE